MRNVFSRFEDTEYYLFNLSQEIGNIKDFVEGIKEFLDEERIGALRGKMLALEYSLRKIPLRDEHRETLEHVAAFLSELEKTTRQLFCQY